MRQVNRCDVARVAEAVTAEWFWRPHLHCTFAEPRLNSKVADKTDIGLFKLRWRSIASRLRHVFRCIGVHVSNAAIQSRFTMSNSNRSFAARSKNYLEGDLPLEVLARCIVKSDSDSEIS